MKSPGDLRGGLPEERALVQHIKNRLPAPSAGVLVGPGDDAAVYAPERGELQIITTDALLEGIHFDRRFSTLGDVGYKALAVNLSDVAAMGGAASAALLSLMLPTDTRMDDVDALLDGLLELATEARVSILGGNISRSPGPLIVDVTAVGHVRPRRILTRGGGKPGDALYVTGTIGAAAAGLAWLKVRAGQQAGTADAARPDWLGQMAAEEGMAGCVRRHLRPEPRLRVGMLLGRNRAASACMDLSDGLADAVRQVAEASGTGALIDAEALPVDPAARRWFTDRGIDPIIAALAGGDDFELLCAVPRKLRGRLRTVASGARGLTLTKIGELTAGGVVLIERDGNRTEVPSGYSHF